MEPFDENRNQKSYNITMWRQDSIKSGCERAMPYIVAIMAVAMVIFVPMTLVAYNRSMVPGPQGDPGPKGLNGSVGSDGHNGQRGEHGPKGDRGKTGPKGGNRVEKNYRHRK